MNKVGPGDQPQMGLAHRCVHLALTVGFHIDNLPTLSTKDQRHLYVNMREHSILIAWETKFNKVILFQKRCQIKNWNCHI
jgi:hypothetical protein